MKLSKSLHNDIEWDNAKCSSPNAPKGNQTEWLKIDHEFWQRSWVPQKIRYMDVALDIVMVF